jgi:hypothetical protein
MTLFRWENYAPQPQPSRDTKGRYTTNRRHALMKAQLMRAAMPGRAWRVEL